MTSDWSPTRLGDLIRLKGGLSYKGENVGSGDALLLGMGAVSNTERFVMSGARKYSGPYRESHLVHPGDLVIATRQQSDNLPILGFPAMVPLNLAGRNVIVGTNLYKVENLSAVSNTFLYWLMKGPEYKRRILASSKGTTVRMLTKDAVEDFHFLLPPEGTRTAIAGFLDALDDKIELNRRMAATLEEMARAIFKSWFIDFDPVRAKAEGRPTNLPPEIDALIPEGLTPEDIPIGWKMRPLDSLGTFLNGLALQKYPPKTERTLPVIKIAQLRKMSTAEADRCGDNLPRDYVVEDGDILFSWSGSLECVVWTGGVGGLNQHLFKVTSDEVPDWFLYFAILEHLPWFRGIAASKATTMGHIQRKHLSEAAVCYNRDVVGALSDTIGPIYNRMWRLQLESRTLAEIRDSLLPKLISGELRVAIQEDND